MSRRKRARTKANHQLAVYCAVGVISTFCIVFALLVNITSNKARKENMEKAERVFAAKELELIADQALAIEKKLEADEQLAKAEATILEYEKSLSEAILAQHQSNRLIEKYEALSKGLSAKLEKTETLGKEREKELAEVKALRLRTLNLRRNVLNFYHKTRKDQRKAEEEIAKAQNAYAVSIARVKKANQLERQASLQLIESRRIENKIESRVEDLEDELARNQASQHVYHYQNHQRQQNRPCPPVIKKPKKAAKPIVGPTKRPGKRYCEVLRLPIKK